MTDFNDIRERVIWVVNHSVGTTHKYPYLEERTGISARKWKNLCNRVQQPSIEMVAALAREFRPKYLEWMVLGQVLSCSQKDPSEVMHIDGNLAYPELLGKQRPNSPSMAKEEEREIKKSVDSTFEALFSKKPSHGTKKE